MAPLRQPEQGQAASQAFENRVGTEDNCRMVLNTHSTYKPTVFVLLPVHNRKEITRKFLSCLELQTYRQVQLIVIDDGSTDGTSTMVRETMSDAVVLNGTGHWWWSGCMQNGFLWLLRHNVADDDLVLLANDDITFEKDFVSNAIDVIGRVPRGLLGARARDQSSGVIHETGVHADLRRFVFRIAERPEQINCLPTRALMLRWSDMREVGGFYPRLLPHYWADYEYTIRASRKGFNCFTSAEVVITENPDTTGDRDLDSSVGPQLFRRLFSMKTPWNPIYRTTFAVLASVGLWKVINIMNVWVRAGFRMIWQGILYRKFPRKRLSRGFL